MATPFRMHASALAAAFAALCLTVACSPSGDGQSRSSVTVTPFVEDVVMGDPNAKVEIVEYASLTCSHCRDFWMQGFQPLKAQYIDTGKVKYILRDFPTQPVELATAGVAIARCKGEDKYSAAIAR
jgi:protein-disulfide isomerase